uniref:MFS domain-containing protein n=1 Tax=Caenorhabditis tropicalis TaxID=1561998 RepID=A0A1I7U698_9PELO
MPKTYCTDDDYCYKMKNKCLTDFVRNSDSDICPFNSTNFGQCVNEASRVDFRSAQFDYQQDCTGLKHFSSSTATFIGTLLGNLILGYISDTFGRRPVFIFSICLGVPAVILSAAIDGVLNFYIFRFIVGFAVAGTLTVGWTYSSEMITPSRRFRLRTFPNWTIGLIEPKLPWLGRRFLFISSQIIAIIAYLGILVSLWTKNKESWWYTISYIFAYAAQSLCLETCYLSLAELMPTDVRSIAGALMNILMKIGTILASTTKPIKFWYEPMLFMINVIICTGGLGVVWKYLPESKNMNIQLVGQDEITEEEEEEETPSTKTTVFSDDSQITSSSIQEESEMTSEKSE